MSAFGLDLSTRGESDEWIAVGKHCISNWEIVNMADRVRT